MDQIPDSAIPFIRSLSLNVSIPADSIIIYCSNSDVVRGLKQISMEKPQHKETYRQNLTFPGFKSLTIPSFIH